MLALSINIVETISNVIVTISNFIIAAIVQFGYVRVFVAMLLESAGMPLPSEVIMPFAGYVAWEGGAHAYRRFDCGHTRLPCWRACAVRDQSLWRTAAS